MAFLHKYNSDNIHSRAVIVGLINLLNNKIQYNNILSDTEVDVVEVPWFFAKSVDERFLQDYFTFWSDCIHPKLVSGNYDISPRGSITLASKSIDSSALTNRFVRGSYVKEINGKLETFNSYLNSVPLKMSFDCEILCPSYTDGFKIEQTIIETFYAVQVYNVYFKGFRIPCQVGFPEDFGLEKNFEYSYGDENETTLKFSLELETYYPVLDKTSERHDSNRMNGFGIEMNMNNLGGENREIRILSPTNKSYNENIPNDTGEYEYYYIGSLLPVCWETIGSILRIDIEFSENGQTGPWLPIVKQYPNSGFYNWSISQFNKDLPYILLTQNGIREAKIRPLINDAGGVEDIILFDGGLGYDNTLEVLVQEENVAPSDVEINPIIINGTINSLQIVKSGSGFTPTQTKTLSIRIKDSNNDTVYSVVNDIKIR